MSEELQQKLRDQLWEVANRLRGNMSASDFMYFTLGFIFYKYLSEKIEKYANNALVDDEITFKELWEMDDTDAVELQEEAKNQCLENIGYFIEPKFLFSSVIEAIKRKENILPMLERSLKRIEDSTLGQDSEEDFGGLFSDIDLASPKLGKTADDKNTLVSNVLLALDDIDFGVEASQEIDILGDAYEYMISQFAAGAGKKAGEFYTPQEVSRILAEIVSIGHQRLRNVYDPTCGSGSLLIRAAHTGRDNTAAARPADIKASANPCPRRRRRRSCRPRRSYCNPPRTGGCGPSYSAYRFPPKGFVFAIGAFASIPEHLRAFRSSFCKPLKIRKITLDTGFCL